MFAPPASAATAVFLDRIGWFQSDDNFGGFSGIEVSADGQGFTVISDKGYWTDGEFTRDQSRLQSASHRPLRPIKAKNGAAVTKYRVDSEGLAMAPDGTFFVSFEGVHRVWRYGSLSQKAARLKRHQDFKQLQTNSGLEALAIDQDGVIYALPERSGEWERPFPVYQYQNGKWTKPHTITRRDKYLPVGADFGPEGWLYLLERDFVWYRGFSSRIRRFQLTENGFENEEILLTSGFGDYDNLEGLAVWQTETGEIRLTTISDNNFSAFQKTEFVEFAVRDSQ